MDERATSLSEDRRLVAELLATRSEAAFVELYRAHSAYLFGLALRLSAGRREDAEEALQEAWLRAVERLASFRFESALRTWLAGIVVHTVRELRRRRHPDREEPRGGWEIERLAEPRGESGAERNAVSAAVAGVDLERALAELPSTLRDVVVLFELVGLGHAEIARLLSIPAGTSKSRLWFARRALRSRLGAGAPNSAGSDRQKEARNARSL